MIIIVMSSIFDVIPQLDSIQPYLFTTYWFDFGEMLRDPIVLKGTALDGVLSAAAYIAIFYSAAWARFMGKDITG